MNISDLFDEEGEKIFHDFFLLFFFCFVDEINKLKFDFSDYLYIHLYCAVFSRQITRNANAELENVISCVSKSLTRKCSHCDRFGANVTCSFNNCDKTYHYPCSAASAGFQHLKTYSFICNSHVDHIPLLRE